MSNSDWWAKRLNNPQPVQQGRPDNFVPMPPSQQPMQQMPVFQQPSSTPKSARSATQTDTCPECWSGNYFSIQNAAPRCFDCGYPVEQRGSIHGTGAGARVEGNVQQALGNNATNNWNPQGIIGRIGD